MVNDSRGIANKALKRSDIKQSDTHMHKHFNTASDWGISRVACSARIPWRHEKGSKQVGSRELWRTMFQRNGFMEMRVKGSIVRPVIQRWWSADTCPATPYPPQYPPTRIHVIWEGVTVHPNHGRDMTCCRLPLSVKYLCQPHCIALMAVKALTRALSLFSSPLFCLSLTHSIQQNSTKTIKWQTTKK